MEAEAGHMVKEEALQTDRGNAVDRNNGGH